MLCSVALGVAVMLFWGLAYPHALSYQEQYQMFLWTGDYLADALRMPGGLAAWMGEWVVQFYYVGWLGALLLGVLFLVLHRLMVGATQEKRHWDILCLVPLLLLLWLMGDESVLLAYPMALLLTLAFSCVTAKAPLYADLLAVPLLYWLAGPMAWLYVALRLLHRGVSACWLPLLLAAVQWAAYQWLLPEWQLYSVLTGRVYYRIPLQTPVLMWVIPLVVIAVSLLSRWAHRPWMWACEVGIVAALAFLAADKGFDSDKYELIRQDYLVRNEQWDEVVRRAEQRQVQTPFSCQCVNLALAKKRLLADRMFDFYQSGRDALIMPRTRDLTSMLPSAEAFWHLGMVNSALRYMFDTQESILNAKKSGRCTKRIAECMIVNGQYKTAAKQLALLRHTLFYRKWALEAETALGDEARVNAHPLWGKLRKLRYKDDFLFNYEELDKMFGQLFIGNQENKMALDYMLAQMLLNGNVPMFSQYLQWAQRYGGYSTMPLGYQDVVRCIQSNGQGGDSPYMRYINAQRSRQQ